MAEIESLVLEQLRLIREELGSLRADFVSFKTVTKAGFDELHGDFVAHNTMIFALAGAIGQIDKRVEHLETKLGG